MLLGGVVGLALLWQGVALGSRALNLRREAQVEVAVGALETLAPPVGFRPSTCEFDGHACMRGRNLPPDSVEHVAAAVAERATAVNTRCFQAVAGAPPDCIVLADVEGVTVAGFVSARLLPKPPIRFSGSDVWFVTVEGSYEPERFFSNQTLVLGPPVESAGP